MSSPGNFRNKQALLAFCPVIITTNVKGPRAKSLPPATAGSNLHSSAHGMIPIYFGGINSNGMVL
jgi:hypothetical protein